MKKIIFTFLCFVLLILQLNASPNSQQLLDAINQQDIKTVKYLIKRGVDVNSATETGLTPLHEAARIGNFKIVKILVKNGADIHAQYGDAEPLYFAALANHPKIMKYFIRKGADVNTKFENISALLAASQKCHKKAIEILMENKAEMISEDVALTPIEAVALALPGDCSIEKKEKILQMMIQFGADINIPRPGIPTGWTALDSAINFGNQDIIEMLLKLGAKSERAIAIYARANNIDMVYLLLENGFDINIKDEDGKTVLDYEISDNMRQFLISHGAKSGKDLQ